MQDIEREDVSQLLDALAQPIMPPREEGPLAYERYAGFVRDLGGICLAEQEGGNRGENQRASGDETKRIVVVAQVVRDVG